MLCFSSFFVFPHKPPPSSFHLSPPCCFKDEMRNLCNVMHKLSSSCGWIAESRILEQQKHEDEVNKRFHENFEFLHFSVFSCLPVRIIRVFYFPCFQHDIASSSSALNFVERKSIHKFFLQMCTHIRCTQVVCLEKFDQIMLETRTFAQFTCVRSYRRRKILLNNFVKSFEAF